MEIGVKDTKDIKFIPEIGAQDLRERSAMSMAVIKEAGALVSDYYKALYRHLYQPESKQPVLESVLAFASSDNGVDFRRSGVIPVKPSKTPESFDQLAVEDPTIVVVDGVYRVFHTAVKPSGRGVTTAIQMVIGPSLENLGNKKIILTPQDVRQELGTVDMVKEPEFFKLKDGTWIMIYEFADRQKSRVAIAQSKDLEGPYRKHRILLDTREDMWDSQHVSAGPLFTTSFNDICILYNGRGPLSASDQIPTWSIGYAVLDAKTLGIKVRSDSPFIRPPSEIGPGNQLIAFANSLIREGDRRIQTLYYTIADKRSACARIVTDL